MPRGAEDRGAAFLATREAIWNKGLEQRERGRGRSVVEETEAEACGSCLVRCTEGPLRFCSLSDTTPWPVRNVEVVVVVVGIFCF